MELRSAKRNLWPQRLLCALFVGCLLSPHAVLAGLVEKTLSDEPEGLYDSNQWAVVKSATASFGKTLPNASVVLLKSVEATGSSGSGESLYSVNLVVSAQGRILYTFAPLTVPAFDARRLQPVFYMDDLLDLRDVTGDHIPEIIFHAGFRAATDWESEVHVIQYDKAGATFRDIRADGFVESSWWRFRWLGVKGGTLAVVAEPLEPSDQPGRPRLHRYLVYGWQAAAGRFALAEIIPSTQQLHRNDQDPFDKDWSYILGKVKKHHPLVK
jgi:hypothetical protein